MKVGIYRRMAVVFRARLHVCEFCACTLIEGRGRLGFIQAALESRLQEAGGRMKSHLAEVWQVGGAANSGMQLQMKIVADRLFRAGVCGQS
jgi:hypothetical protein